MLDGSYETFEAVKRLDTVIIVPTIRNKIIMIEEEQPDKPKSMGFISGKIERKERPLIAAKRELLEETGFKSNNWILLEIREAIKSQKVDWNLFMYIARDCKRVAKPKIESGEKIKIKYIDFSTFLLLPNKIKNLDYDLKEDINKIKNSKETIWNFKKQLFGESNLSN
jgi:ADP-ribose pyrophosphatase